MAKSLNPTKFRAGFSPRNFWAILSSKYWMFSEYSKFRSNSHFRNKEFYPSWLLSGVRKIYPRKKAPLWEVRGRVRIRLGAELGLEFGGIFSGGGDFFLEAYCPNVFIPNFEKFFFSFLLRFCVLFESVWEIFVTYLFCMYIGSILHKWIFMIV